MFTLSNLLKRGSNYFLLVLLARTIPVSVFGTYSAYINIIGVLLLVTNFGFSEYLLVNSEDNRLLKINSSNFLQVSFLLFIILFIGLCFFPKDDSILAALVLIKIFLETQNYKINKFKQLYTKGTSKLQKNLSIDWIIKSIRDTKIQMKKNIKNSERYTM